MRARVQDRSWYYPHKPILTHLLPSATHFSLKMILFFLILRNESYLESNNRTPQQVVRHHVR